MVGQLRIFDPSAGANVGTPERLLIETAAQAIHDDQVDLTVLTQSLDLDSKFGVNLDKFLGLFRFGRQAAVPAKGFVTFKRNTPATVDTPIPEGVRLKTTPDDTGSFVIFSTTLPGVLAAGETEVQIPVRAVVSGAFGNVGANSITQFVGDTVFGITSVTNEVATSNGRDQETDAEYKTRFQTTYFRNLAGTSDQYLALAVASNFTSKANVVGPISRYREYIQVPAVDDATANPPYGAGNGNVGEYTTALSTIPFAKYIFVEVPNFVSNGAEGVEAIFYRSETDFELNTDNSARNRGDAYRLAVAAEAPSAAASPNQPNVTFFNVYTGGDPDVEALRPGDVVLLEFSYQSNESRNDVARAVANAVDVFIDSSNQTAASNTIARPTAATTMFVNSPTEKNHFDNFRRVGEPEHRPMVGNLLTPLFFEPVVDVPDVIVVEGGATTTYYRDIHYWAVEDVSDLGGTTRARSGIEWSMAVRGSVTGDPDNGPFTGAFISEHASATAVPIEGYFYDRNVNDLQAAYEAGKQTTSDVLAHKARLRYFGFDVTVMYSPGFASANVNQAIRQAVQDLLRSLYFGSVIQLSDVLQTIHNVDGVDNVRWSSDVPGFEDLERVQEVTVDGLPLSDVIVDQATVGTVSTVEVLRAYQVGSPTGGSVTFNYAGTPGAALSLPISSAGALQTNLRAISGVPGTLTVSGAGTITDPFVISFGANGVRSFLGHVTNATGGPTVYSGDLILRDNELASLPDSAQVGDTVAGLKIRARAQNTWIKR